MYDKVYYKGQVVDYVLHKNLYTFQNLKSVISRIFANNEQGFFYDPSDLSNLKLKWRRNLLNETEFRFGLSNLALKGGDVTATPFTGLSGGTGLLFVKSASAAYGYKLAPATLSKGSFSFYIRMLDGGVPVVGNSADPAADLSIVIAGGVSSLVPQIINLGDGLYRIVRFIDVAVPSGSNIGIVKYPTHSSRSFTVSGWQFEYSEQATEYQPFTDFNTEFLKVFPNHTLYQDIAGTTPLISSEQPLNLLLDKSKGLVLSSELYNQTIDFSTWTKTAAVTSAVGNTFTTNGLGGCIKNPIIFGLPAQKCYNVRIIGTCTAAHKIRSSSSVTGEVLVQAGAFDITIKSPLTFYDGTLYFQLQAAGTITVNSISIKEITGNHAYQATSAARPLLKQIPIIGQSILNESFNNGTTGWTLFGDAVYSVTNGVLSITANAATTGIYKDFVVQSGKSYILKAKITGQARVIAYSAYAFSPSLVSISNGASIATFTSTSTALRVYLYCNSSQTGTLDDVQLDELLGYRIERNYVEYDGIDDKLLTNFTASLSNCTVVRAIPNIGTKILYNQTLPTSYEDILNHAGLFAINRSLSNVEKVLLLNEMDQRSGITSGDSQITRSFTNNEQGIAFNDFNDLSVLFQDSTGTIPVTAVGQPVGLVLDKSKGLVLSNEKVINANFDTDTIWTKGTGVSISGGFAVLSNATGNPVLSQNAGLQPGKWYDITIVVTEVTSSSIALRIYGTASNDVILFITTAGTYKAKVRARDDATGILGFSASGTSAKIKSISCKEIAGNHAYQTSSASRPLLCRHPISGVRNLINFSEDNSKWTISAAGTGITPVMTYGKSDPLGTNTATNVVLNIGSGTTLSDHSTLFPQSAATINTVVGKSYTASVWLKTSDGTTKTLYLDFNGETPDSGTVALTIVTPTWTRYIIKLASADITTRSLAIRLKGSLGTDTSASIDVWGPQQEGGLTATAYQKTNGIYDITEAGVQNSNNLYFDGIDDFLQTNNIDFTTTNKISVFTGVRKLSDTVQGRLLETGTNYANPVGGFMIAAPASTTGGGNYGAALSSSNSQTIYTGNNELVGYVSPVSSVLSTSFDLSKTDYKDVLKFRINGVLKNYTASPTWTGGGTYSNSPLYIGRRGGTALPFTGHLYSLVILGRLASDIETTTIEKAIAKQIGVTI